MADVITNAGGFTYYSGSYDLSVALNAYSLSQQKRITPQQALAQINPAAAASGLYKFDSVTGRPVAPSEYQNSRFSSPSEVQNPNSIFYTAETKPEPLANVTENVFDGPMNNVEEQVFDGPMNNVEEQVFDGPMNNVEEQVFDGPMNNVEENVFDGPMNNVEENVFDAPMVPVSATPTTVVSRPNITQYNQSIIPNPLELYSNYTYNLSLHLLTETQFNNFLANPGGPAPQRTIIASAGRYVNRDPSFGEDFYFEDLKITTVVNATKKNRNTNMIECNFTVIEPLGFTLINRLLEAVANAGGKNYIKQPYMLQIDFFGQNESGVFAPIKNLTKYIPICFTSLKSRVTSRGTEYAIEAVPYNHQAFNTLNVASPAALTVKASTVKELLGAGPATNTTAQTFYENDGTASTSGQYQPLGFIEGLNAYYKDLVDRKEIFFQNDYKIEIDPAIASAKIFPSVSPNNLASTASGGTSPKDQKNNIKAQAGQAVGQINFNSGVFNIPAGTKIDQLIDYAIRNSDYIKDQLADPTGYTAKENFGQIQTKLGNPLKWFRIIPKIKIKPNSYDPARQQYAYEITYVVKPWTVNTKHPYAPQGRTPGYVKEYNYIFTGKNKNVIDLQLDFDMLYYTQIISYRNKGRLNETGDAAGQQQLRGEIYEWYDAPTDIPGPGKNAQVTVTDRVQPVARGFVSGDAGKTARTGPQQSLAVTAGDVQKDITLDSKGDMINIKLRIIGDPTFIKQDDIFYNQTLAPQTGMLTPNGSIVTDGGELYVYVNFESPSDYNEIIGQAPPAISKYRYSEFSGIYKVITIENSFRSGKFEQNLDLVRLPIQDQLRNQTTNAFSRLDSYVNLQLGQFALPASRFSGPNILLNAVGAGASGILNAALTGGSISGAASALGGSIVNAAMSYAQGKINEGIQKGIKEVSDIVLKDVKGIFDPVGKDIAEMAKDFDSSLLNDFAEELGLGDLLGDNNLTEFADDFLSLDTDVLGDFSDLVDFGDFGLDGLGDFGLDSLGDLGDFADIADLGSFDLGSFADFAGGFF